MIAHLRGRLAARRPTAVVVDVGGVGYLVHVPAGVPGQLGDEVQLHTSLQVREDAMTLYGFASAAARDLFELLLAASGVGPKLALAALSTHPTPALRRALIEGDVAALTLVPGIGRKVAQRLVLELRDRVGGAEPAGDAPPSGAPDDGHGALGEVRLALLELGYSSAEAQRALASLEPDGEVSDLLRAALRSLATVAP